MWFVKVHFLSQLLLSCSWCANQINGWPKRAALHSSQDLLIQTRWNPAVVPLAPAVLFEPISFHRQLGPRHYTISSEQNTHAMYLTCSKHSCPEFNMLCQDHFVFKCTCWSRILQKYVWEWEKWDWCGALQSSDSMSMAEWLSPLLIDWMAQSSSHGSVAWMISVFQLFQLFS